MAKKNPIELLISIISEVIELTKENKLTGKELKKILGLLVDRSKSNTVKFVYAPGSILVIKRFAKNLF